MEAVNQQKLVSSPQEGLLLAALQKSPTERRERGAHLQKETLRAERVPRLLEQNARVADERKPVVDVQEDANALVDEVGD